MAEFGLFGSEGCCERGFSSREEAAGALASRYSPEDGLHVAEVCHDHPDHEQESCGECATTE